LSQGCAFSANSRFLYINTLTQIFQFDTWAPDLEASEILIDTVPLYQSDPDWFAISTLAPDNKIYFSTYNSIKALHVINQPDSLGLACNFVEKGLTLPMYNIYSIPNAPNYDLDTLQGVDTCSALYTNSHTLRNENASFRIAPNPASDWLNIIYQTDEDALLDLFDMYEKRVNAISLFHYFKNRLLNVSALAAGVYLAAVTEKGKRIWSEKVVIVH
jgi:hypothetical protein